MNLTITTPNSVLVDIPNIRYIRAQDGTGSFGIQPHHLDFLTSLTVSVLTWTGPEGTQHAAVRGGIFRVHKGNVSVATREATLGDNLKELESEIVNQYRRNAQADIAGRQISMRLENDAFRLLAKYLRPEGNKFGA